MTWNEIVRSLNQNRWTTEKRTLKSQKQKLKKRRFSGAYGHGWERQTTPVSFWGTWIGARGPSIRLPSLTELWRWPKPPSPSLVAQADGSVAAGTGALVYLCPCPGPGPCPGLCPGPGAVCPSRLSSPVPSHVPTLLSSAASPCHAPVRAPVRAPFDAALAPVPSPFLVPSHVVCSLFPFPVLALFLCSYGTDPGLCTGP